MATYAVPLKDILGTVAPLGQPDANPKPNQMTDAPEPLESSAILDSEEVIGHPRDPYWRVDTRRSSLEVEVRLEGHTLAQTTSPLLLFETMLPVRYYLPPEAIRVPLIPSDTRSICPYKGRASYWSIELDGHTYRDLIWSYTDPLPEITVLDGLLCFYNERVDLLLDGELRPRRRPSETSPAH